MTGIRRLLPLLALLLALGPAPARASSAHPADGTPEIPTLEQATGMPADFLAEAWASLELIVEARAGSAWRFDATRTADRAHSGHRSADPIVRLRAQRAGTQPYPAIGFRTGYLAARSSAVPPPLA